MGIEQYKFRAWVMFDNHTFHKVTGSLDEIREEISAIKNREPSAFAGWGSLRFLDEETDALELVSGLQSDLKKLSNASVTAAIIEQKAKAKIVVENLKDQIKDLNNKINNIEGC